MDRKKCSAWRKNVRFFSSCHSIPALVDTKLTIDIGCMALDGFRGNIEFESDLFDTQWPV